MRFENQHFSGTEIDDEEYFSTLEQNTNLMLLIDHENWKIRKKNSLISNMITEDDTDYISERDYSSCVHCLNSFQLSMVSQVSQEFSDLRTFFTDHLNVLCDMNPESLADIALERQVI